ncbi:MAG: TIGR02300 family protein [Rhodobacteraceae bacterium]|nr:TIGR02300 family protein [Paracoccaceae bacterium]
MPKEDWGTKRLCPATGRHFYDLNRTPVISPYTGEVVPLDGPRGRTLVSEKTAAKVSVGDADDLDDDIILDDDTEADLEDELLEDDDDNVSLDDLADVAGDEEEV